MALEKSSTLCIYRLAGAGITTLDDLVRVRLAVKRYIDDILGINSHILFDHALTGWTSEAEDAYSFKGIYPLR